jgi:hypothetical protein
MNPENPQEVAMKPTKGNIQEDLERWENEGGSTPARQVYDERRASPAQPRRHTHQPGGLWGMCSRLLEGMGQMFGIRRQQAR